MWIVQPVVQPGVIDRTAWDVDLVVFKHTLLKESQTT